MSSQVTHNAMNGTPRLQGKRALITGSGTGIGREVALQFARQGAGVVLHYSSSREGAESAVEEIKSSGGTASLLHADLGKVDDCAKLVDYAASSLGGLDILVNNAGITEWGPFDDVTPEQFDKLYHVNIRGDFFCAQRAVRHMSDHGGVIVNMTSVHGLEGQPGHSVYSGTKGAIIAWTRELAVELAPRKISRERHRPRVDRRAEPLPSLRGLFNRSGGETDTVRTGRRTAGHRESLCVSRIRRGGLHSWSSADGRWWLDGFAAPRVARQGMRGFETRGQ